MATILSDNLNTAKCVGRQRSARVFARAADGNAAIHFWAPHDPERVSSAWRMAKICTDWIELAPINADEPAPESLGDCTLEVRMRLPEAVYGFRTTRLPDHQRSTNRVRLMRPESIDLIDGRLIDSRPADRRRSTRRRFREAGYVIVTAPQSRGEGHEQARGTLLNLSMNGLACLLPEEDAPVARPGSTVRVEFRADPRSAPFVLLARTVGVTHAGSPGRVVVGMEFIIDDRMAACLEALRQAIQAEAE